jgi:hypothetical protein
MLIQSQKVDSDSKQLQQLNSAECGKAAQNPQPIRNQKGGKQDAH